MEETNKDLTQSNNITMKLVGTDNTHMNQYLCVFPLSFLATLNKDVGEDKIIRMLA